MKEDKQNHIQSENINGSSILSTNGLNETSGPLRMIFEKN